MSMSLPYATTDYSRQVLKTPRITFKNRFVEANPVLSEKPVAAISRPALRKFTEVGDGPVRSLYSSASLFNDVLFVVSNKFLYTTTALAEVTLIGELSENLLSDVSWAAVASIGATPSRLFIAEGSVLWVYAENGEAFGQLQVTSFTNGDQVRIGTVYYQMTSGSVDAGTPAGTAANPWLVNIATGITPDHIENLFNAINDTGVAGTAYSTALTVHPTVTATAYAAADLFVSAKDFGPDGNSIVTTETGANMAWNAATLTGGGEPKLRQVPMPNEVGAISIVHINSYVIVVPVQSEDLETVGRFYWIEPGETFVDPINFATAERYSDEIHQVGVFGDKFWLFGAESTEPWITTGDPDAPMLRFTSILFDRGSWEGTAIQVKDSLIVVDENGGVFQISGGQQRISRPDIEERIRRAIQIQSEEILI